jgi:hypothetical protein
MNERIKELAEQAGFVLWKNESWNPGETIDWASSYDNELQKFAELIVKECLDQCYFRGMNDPLYEGQLKAAAYIEEHFGVEE